MYLANYTRPYITFTVLLARYSFTPIKRHQNGVKHIFHYLRETTKLELFYCGSNSQLIGYADVSYLSNLYKGRSQTSYLFTYRGTTISWRSIKQTLMTTLSNHSEIVAIHEASRECIWLSLIIQHIKKKYGLSTIENSPIILFKDNVGCITQLRGNYIKGDKTKHISPKFFYTQRSNKREKLITNKSCEVII